MKRIKAIIIGIFSVGLLLANFFVISGSDLKDGYKNLFTVKHSLADASNNFAGQYELRTVHSGNGVIEQATLNGVTYQRTCSYTQVKCEGSGTKSCVPSLSTYNYGTWTEVSTIAD